MDSSENIFFVNTDSCIKDVGKLTLACWLKLAREPIRARYQGLITMSLSGLCDIFHQHQNGPAFF